MIDFLKVMGSLFGRIDSFETARTQREVFLFADYLSPVKHALHFCKCTTVGKRNRRPPERGGWIQIIHIHDLITNHLHGHLISGRNNISIELIFSRSD
ncbi:hypothetical protein ES703_64476 [subsurface metagenome]